MFHKYNNFVRPITSTEFTATKLSRINGNEARKLYLEEVGNVQETFIVNEININNKINSKPPKNVIDTECTVSNRDLFLTVQNNHVDKLRDIFKKNPDKINILDEYGWSLLMIACQANSIECVEELLNRGIDTSVRDKAGNSARSLVIRNKSIELVNILLNNRHIAGNSCNISNKQVKDFFCKICNNKFKDRNEHLSSTIHNLFASKGKKVPTNYVLPESNKGFQIMLKGGWDKETGLGLDGLGKKYPIKTIIKNDRKGLGNKLNKGRSNKDEIKSSRNVTNNRHKNRKIEIEFRRQFY